MNQGVNGNRDMFWMEVNYAIEGKMESCSRINDGNGRLILGEVEMRKILKV